MPDGSSRLGFEKLHINHAARPGPGYNGIEEQFGSIIAATQRHSAVVHALLLVQYIVTAAPVREYRCILQRDPTSRCVFDRREYMRVQYQAIKIGRSPIMTILLNGFRHMQPSSRLELFELLMQIQQKSVEKYGLDALIPEARKALGCPRLCERMVLRKILFFLLEEPMIRMHALMAEEGWIEGGAGI